MNNRKKIVGILAAMLVIGGGATYAVGTGFVQFGAPTQAEIDASISQAADAAAQKAVQEMQSIAAQEQTPTEPEVQQPEAVAVVSQQDATSKIVETDASSVPAAPAPKPETVTVTGIAFNKSADLTLSVGNTNRRSATTTPAGQPVVYTSGNPNVATVTADGTVTCFSVGKTVITAQSGSATAAYNLTVVAAVNAPAPSVPASAAKDGESSISSADTDALALEMICLVNDKRESVGLSALEIDSDLMAHAEIRAKEIGASFSHTRPDGTVETSECAAANQQSPTGAFQAWMESDPHRTAILNENGKFNYKYIGAGCYRKVDGSQYWILTFSKGNSSPSDRSPTNEGSFSNDASSPTNMSYSLNATELSLTAGEGYQLSIEPSDGDVQVDWSVLSLAEGILSVDDSGYVTTYYRDGMTSAKATITVSAKVTAPGKRTKSLHCKVIVTQ